MARGVNKVILVGNLGADPEVRYTAGGSAVAKLRVATTTPRKDEQSGEWQDQTEWHSVVLFGRNAEVAGEYLRKGRQVYIEGRLQTRKWQDQGGQDRYTTEIIGNDMQMLGGRGEDSGYAASGDNAPAYAPPAAAPAPRAAPRPASAPAASAPPPPANDFDEDIPF